MAKRDRAAKRARPDDPTRAPVFTKLSLDGQTPLRAQPQRGEWGPLEVPSTRAKKWLRIVVPIVAVAVAVGLFFLGRYFYLLLIGG